MIPSNESVARRALRVFGPRRGFATLLYVAALGFPGASTVPAAELPQAPAGLESAGNVDGVLTWSLGRIEPGRSVREVVFFAHGASHDAVLETLQVARERFAKPTELPAIDRSGPPPAKAWIRNDATDFALEGPCFFSWKMERQALACSRGGQLSQFTYYVHHGDAAGRRRAGIPQEGDTTPENLRIVDPPRVLAPADAVGAVETSDGRLRIRVRATLGQGSVVALEFVLTNQGGIEGHEALPAVALEDVTLSVYANIEAAHDHENDFASLDATAAGFLVNDPPTGACVIVAGLRPPAQGYSGVWDSLEKARAPLGVAFEAWTPFRGLPAGFSKRLSRGSLAARGVYLPSLDAPPETPPTRTLSGEEEAACLERDWIFQAMGRSYFERAVAEIGWTRSLAERIATDPRAGDLGRERAELAGLDDRLHSFAGKGADEAGARALYLDIRRLKRRIAFKNPLLYFERLLFIDQPMPRGPVNDIHESIHRMGITATPGGRLLLLEGLRPGGKLTRLPPEAEGSYWRPDLSFDARRVVFCFKPKEEGSFHLYEVGIDGTGLRRLTSGDYDDVDPLAMPDGHLIFTTTRGNSHVRCGPFIYSFILARCDADGGNIYLISCNGEPDFVPSLLDDGRVAYSRWEYSDKPLWRIQSLWTTNQDGTRTAVLWGNQSVWPDHLSEPRQIPGSRRILFSGVGHHDWFSGSIGIVDPERGFNFPSGLTKVTHDLRWPECSIPPSDAPESPDYHASGSYTGYKSPYPLGERDFLVSARGADGRFRLYWMDTLGNRELIYEGSHNIWHAIPVRPRQAPAIQPDGVAWPGQGADRKPLEAATFYSPDVVEGSGIPRAEVRYLRVMQLDHKTYSTWAKTYRHSGPPVSIVQEEGVKRVISIVPVEEDGSVYFKVPPGRSLYFQLLDANHRAIQTMRSFTGALPGERRGCTGCHEQRAEAPAPTRGLAFRRPPTELSPPEWGTESIGYERFAQPVLDRHCGRCHQGEGGARKTLDLTLRPGHDVFKEPYLTLVGSAGWGNPVPDRGQAGYGIAGAIPVESMDPTMNDPKAYATLAPYSYLSGASRLVEHAASGTHHDVRVDPADLRRLMIWIDACCPYLGEEEVRAIADPDFEDIADLPVRPRVRTAPIVERP